MSKKSLTSTALNQVARDKAEAWSFLACYGIAIVLELVMAGLWFAGYGVEAWWNSYFATNQAFVVGILKAIPVVEKFLYRAFVLRSKLQRSN